jgi:hypothetical protein
MAVPRYDEIMLPLLERTRNGARYRYPTIFKDLADYFSLSEADLAVRNKTGAVKFEKNVRWAKQYLCAAKLLQGSRFLQITDRGLKVLNSGVATITYEFLMQYEEFRNWRTGQKDEIDTAGSGDRTGETPMDDTANSHPEAGPERDTEVLRVRKYGPGGEGQAHKTLKEWVADHPEALDLGDIESRKIEYVFISGDAADVVFFHKYGGYTVVEIETTTPLPGAHQCIKYRSLLCASKGLPLDARMVHAMLVAWSIPQEVAAFCDKYGIGFREIVLPGPSAPLRLDLAVTGLLKIGPMPNRRRNRPHAEPPEKKRT